MGWLPCSATKHLIILIDAKVGNLGSSYLSAPMSSLLQSSFPFFSASLLWDVFSCCTCAMIPNTSRTSHPYGVKSVTAAQIIAVSRCQVMWSQQWEAQQLIPSSLGAPSEPSWELWVGTRSGCATRSSWIMLQVQYAYHHVYCRCIKKIQELKLNIISYPSSYSHGCAYCSLICCISAPGCRKVWASNHSLKACFGGSGGHIGKWSQKYIREPVIDVSIYSCFRMMSFSFTLWLTSQKLPIQQMPEENHLRVQRIQSKQWMGLRQFITHDHFCWGWCSLLISWLEWVDSWPCEELVFPSGLQESFGKLLGEFEKSIDAFILVALVCFLIGVFALK